MMEITEEMIDKGQRAIEGTFFGVIWGDEKREITHGDKSARFFAERVLRVVVAGEDWWPAYLGEVTD